MRNFPYDSVMVVPVEYLMMMLRLVSVMVVVAAAVEVPVTQVMDDALQ